MNERIKLLAKQATITEYGVDNGFDRVTFDKEKFAEWIVKEAGSLLMSPEFIGRTDLDWSMVLNEHFGVEE